MVVWLRRLMPHAGTVVGPIERAGERLWSVELDGDEHYDAGLVVEVYESDTAPETV